MFVSPITFLIFSLREMSSVANDILFSPIRIHELELLIENSVQRALQNIGINTQPSTDADQWLDLNELCVYLPDKPAKQTVYGWVHNSLIPYHKKSKKLFF